MLIIGSHALKRLIDINRVPRDIDIMGSYEECMEFIKEIPAERHQIYPIAGGKKIIATFKDGQIVEAELAWEGSTTAEFIKIMNEFGFEKYPPLDGLYALKISHRFLKNSPAFLKTMRDIQRMRLMGARIPEYLQDWFNRREKETYDYSHPSLKKSKKEFFNGDGVSYVFDHDSIHQAVKHLDRPAYQFFKDDQTEVFCSRAKFEDCDQQTQLFAVLEESYVLALERSQIPHAGKVSPKASFEMALMKVCTSITSGWFRAFAWENYDAVLDLYSDDYVTRFWRGVDSGIVKRC